ncbi:hypothetical protein QAD02_021252 [Eretmocerus hayati]|uniref:Uncharacterized protein n=1 Tax=Eretmocerus hayati TaxID=131215 RepID=A0ACC2PS89_9HYME|nr:hypothetical protein QAD02_021252 [Eretmocerus hayati]
MSCSERPNSRVLELSQNDDSECQDLVKFIIAPTTWINFDSQKKRLIVEYSFPPCEEEEDEDFLKGISKSRAPAPDSWPSYPIAKELGDTTSKDSSISSVVEEGEFDISSLSKDISLTEDLTPNISKSSQNVENCNQHDANNSPSAKPDIPNTDNSKIIENSSNMMSMNNAVDLKSFNPRSFNSLAQQMTANSNALTELKNLLKSRETQSNGRTIMFLDDIKAQDNLAFLLETIPEFITFDKKLSNLALKQDLATYFGVMITPQNNGRNSIREVLEAFCRKAVFKDNYLALQVPDGSTKKAFIETNFGKLLYENVRARLHIDDSLIRDSFSKVILGIEDWERGRAERFQKPGNSQNED